MIESNDLDVNLLIIMMYRNPLLEKVEGCFKVQSTAFEVKSIFEIGSLEAIRNQREQKQKQEEHRTPKGIYNLSRPPAPSRKYNHNKIVKGN